FILYFSSNYAIQTINKIKIEMNAMATGDFSINDSDILEFKDDEFGEISKSANKMKISIRNMVESIMDKSQLLASHSEELTATTYKSSKSADEISQTISFITENSTNQAADVEIGLNVI